MSLINLVVAAGNSFGDWRRRQRAFHELMALDDRSLADIGIHRSRIPALVEGMYQAAHTVSANAPAHGPRAARLATGHR
jgi:uncharacterized protein YjiS (DUF1127 family)